MPRLDNFIINEQAQLNRGHPRNRWRFKGNRPNALGISPFPAQRQKHDTLHSALSVRFYGKPKRQPFCRIIAECQAQLPGLRLLPAQGPGGRVIGQAAVEPNRNLIDQEDEMMAVIQHGQPGMATSLGHTLQSLLAKRIGAATDGPAIVAHVVGSQGEGIPPGIRQ
jgi:hypothetical protein